MKWRAAKKKSPQEGQARARKKFVWWPTKGDDGFTHWLGWVRIEEVYTWTYGIGFRWRRRDIRGL